MTTLAAQPQTRWHAVADRIRATPEFARLELHPKAGLVEGDRQYWFDGSATVHPWGDADMHLLMELTAGAGEPQEIVAFLEVIAALPEDATVVELGAGWAFYSVLAGRRLPRAKLIAVEANPRLVEIGRRNFELNGLSARARVLHAAACDRHREPLRFREAGYGSFLHNRGEYAVPGLSVDGLIEDERLNRIDVLHMDVQSAEAAVLDGAVRALAQRRIGHVFVGTHNNALHDLCEHRLRAAGYAISLSLNLDRSASGDGILVARAPRANEATSQINGRCCA